MNLNETIAFLKNCSEEEKKKFVKGRIEYLRNNDVEKNKYGQSPSIQARFSGPVAFRTFLDEDLTQIVPANSFESIYTYYFDISEEIFNSLIDEIRKSDDNNIPNLCDSVSKVVFDYLGGREVKGTLKDRLSHIKDEDALETGEKNYISSFKETGNAWCTERATIVHQLFKMLGVESEIIISPISVDGKNEHHAFNMIRGDKNTILIDATMIDYSKLEENYDSIVDVLPYDSFDTLKDVPERKFKGKNNEDRTCIINPKGTPLHIVNVGYYAEHGL